MKKRSKKKSVTKKQNNKLKRKTGKKTLQTIVSSATRQALKITKTQVNSKKVRNTRSRRQNAQSLTRPTSARRITKTVHKTTSPKHPIVFVPGVMGSELWDGSIQRWPILTTIGLKKLAMDENGNSTFTATPKILKQFSIKGFYKVKVYADFFKFMKELGKYEEGKNLFSAAYDWRCDLASQTHYIRKAIDQTGSDKVIIVAHSMGGILTRAFLAQYPDYIDKIEKIFFLGTPHYGAPEVWRMLYYGEHPIPLISLKSDIKAATRTMPGVYQLLPTKHYVIIEGQQSEGFLKIDGTLKKLNYTYNTFSQDSFKIKFNSKYVKNANKFHQNLVNNWDRSYWENKAYFFYNDDQITTVGHQQFTSINIDHAIIGPGDESVPRTSALPVGLIANMNTQTVGPFKGIKHSDLPSTKSVIQKILSIIESSPPPLQPIPTSDKPDPLPASKLKNKSSGGDGPLGRGHKNKKLVSLLQKALVYLGYDLGSFGPNKDGVDGYFGDKTHSAVLSFQRSHFDIYGNPLVVDGLVGEKTAGSINKALSNNSPNIPLTETRPYPKVNVQLPTQGNGYYYNPGTDVPGSDNWGTKEMIGFLIDLGDKWSKKYPNGPLIGINDISKKGGGPFPPHHSHQKGIDVDIRPIRKDNKKLGTNIFSTSYDQKKTQELVDLIYETGNIDLILFNDPSIKGVISSKGHDNHLHVRIK